MASPNSQTLDFDALVTTTMRNYLETQVQDNVFNAMPLFAFLNAMGRKKTVDGGEYLVEPLLYGKNTTVKSMQGYDTIDAQPMDGITAATFNWKMIAGSLVYSLEEKLKNAGRSKIIDLMETKVFQLEQSINDEMETELLADGTGNAGKDITGLQAIIGNSGILGGIDRATYVWWKSYVDSTVVARSINQWITAYNTCGGNGKTKCDFIMANQTDYEWYEQQAYGKIQIEKSGGGDPMADLGFQTLKFKGATVAYDEYMTTAMANAFFLNSQMLRLRVHTEGDFKKTEQKQPSNQLAWIWQLYWFGNLCTGNCRRLGKITAKT